MSDRSLDGRSVVITGGGTGIGAASASVAAAAGALVTICGRTESTLEATAGRIRSAGGEVHTVIADVTNEDDVARVLSTAVDVGGGLAGVVANAGGGGMLGPYHLQEVDEFERVLRLNLVSTMLCVKHAVPAPRPGRRRFLRRHVLDRGPRDPSVLRCLRPGEGGDRVDREERGG